MIGGCPAALSETPGEGAPRSVWRTAELPALLATLLAFGVFLCLPITAGDTDLWYHLNGGRYIFSHFSLPQESFFSFVAPPRPWVDYYWGFQALVYLVHSAAGYPGLVVLRAVLFASAVLLTVRFAAESKRGGWLGPLFAALCVLLFFSGRYSLVRPHTFSYLFAILTIWILENPRRWAPLVPLIAVAWCNIHGVTYPVLLLILGAYLAEDLWRRVRGGPTLPGIGLAALIVAMLAPLATPHGWRLLPVPFTDTSFARQYILELQPTNFLDLLTGGLGGLRLEGNAAWGALALGALAGLWAQVRERRLRLAHLLLLAGACALLPRSIRFAYEFAILTLPLSFGPSGLPRVVAWISRSAAAKALLTVVVLANLWWFGADNVRNREAWPFSPKNLPVGVCEFLNTQADGGRVLNAPNRGGYYQWALGERFKIFMDMEIPFLFWDEDMFVATHIFSDETVFSRILRRYSPDFIAVPLNSGEIPSPLAERTDEYALVFFDDTAALYARRDRHAALVERFEIRQLDPYTLAGKTLEELLSGAGGEETILVEEIERLLSVYPAHGLANQLAAMLALKGQNPGTALQHAERIVRWFPASPRGYKLKGDALRALGRLDEALASYDEAVRRSAGPIAQKALYAKGLIYAQKEDAEKAYESFKASVRPFDDRTTHEELYYLGSAAFLVKRPKEALWYYRMAQLKVPPEDEEWAERLERHIQIARGILGEELPEGDWGSEQRR